MSTALSLGRDMFWWIHPRPPAAPAKGAWQEAARPQVSPSLVSPKINTAPVAVRRVPS